MYSFFILLLMVFCHIIDDYCLQSIGMLGLMKQRSWWEKNYPDPKYRYDYVVALVLHSFSWAFMVMLPIAAYMEWSPNRLFIILFAINAVLHGVVDHTKANLLKINLIVDQTIHMVQIVITYLILI